MISPNQIMLSVESVQNRVSLPNWSMLPKDIAKMISLVSWFDNLIMILNQHLRHFFRTRKRTFTKLDYVLMIIVFVARKITIHNSISFLFPDSSKYRTRLIPASA